MPVAGREFPERDRNVPDGHRTRFDSPGGAVGRRAAGGVAAARRLAIRGGGGAAGGVRAPGGATPVRGTRSGAWAPPGSPGPRGR